MLPGKEKTVSAKKTEPVAETFVELLRQQFETLQSDDYEYTRLDIYTTGSDEPWSFGPSIEWAIHEKEGLLVARDGPSDELGAEGIPEYVIRLHAIVGSQLVV